MRLNEVNVERVFNLGNFESLRIGVKVSPSPDEEQKQFDEAAKQIIEDINIQISRIKEGLNIRK